MASFWLRRIFKIAYFCGHAFTKAIAAKLAADIIYSFMYRYSYPAFLLPVFFLPFIVLQGKDKNQFQDTCG